VKILLNHPGPNWSVADVYTGWRQGLRDAGATVIEYGFHDRLWLWQHVQLEQDGEYRYVAPFELATRLALEGLGAAIYEDQPDAVLFVSGFWLRSGTLDLIRARGQRVVLLCTESPYEDQQQLELAAHADITILNDPTNIEQFAEVTKAVYVPHSYDPRRHRPGPPTPALQSDLCIVGTGYPSRVKYLETMDLTGVDVALLGNWQAAEHSPLATMVRQPALDTCIDNDQAVDWYRSTKASLNLYRREHGDGGHADGYAMGPREVELAATGTFFLTERRPENEHVLPMIPKVDGPDDATEQLRWWLSHDQARQRVIENAKTAIADWTFEHRAALLLQLLDTL